MLAFGDITAQKIVELERFPLDARWLIANADPAVVAAEQPRLGDDFITPDGRLVIGVHSWLVRAGGLTILVDTCCGNGRERGTASPFHNLDTAYLANLARAGVTPEEVDLVFCTHLHVDHVGWNVIEKDGRFVPTFPNARYLFNPTDFEHRMAAEREGTGSPATRAAFTECVLPIVEAGRATFLEPGHDVLHEVDDALRVVALPGHCPGHCGLEIAARGGHGLLTGDAIHHPLQLARPEWYCAADVDPDESARTRRMLVERYGDTDTRILTAHFGGTSAGRIVGRGGEAGFSFVD